MQTDSKSGKANKNKAASERVRSYFYLGVVYALSHDLLREKPPSTNIAVVFIYKNPFKKALGVGHSPITRDVLPRALLTNQFLGTLNICYLDENVKVFFNQGAMPMSISDVLTLLLVVFAALSYIDKRKK